MKTFLNFVRSTYLLRNLRILLGAAIVLNLCACSLFSFKNSVQYRDAEGVFSKALLESVEPNKTQETWLLAQFGEPLFTDEGPLNSRICTWRFARQKIAHNRVMFVFNAKSLKEETRYLHVLLQQGTVKKVWHDGFELVDTQRIFASVEMKDKLGVVQEAQNQRLFELQQQKTRDQNEQLNSRSGGLDSPATLQDGAAQNLKMPLQGTQEDTRAMVVIDKMPDTLSPTTSPTTSPDNDAEDSEYKMAKPMTVTKEEGMTKSELAPSESETLTSEQSTAFNSDQTKGLIESENAAFENDFDSSSKMQEQEDSERAQLNAMDAEPDTDLQVARDPLYQL